MQETDVAEIFTRFVNYTGLSQIQIAQRLGVSKQKISAISKEGRGLTRETIQRICDEFNIDARYFFGQVKRIEDADLSREENQKSSAFEETVLRKLNELNEKTATRSDLDPVAKRVMIDAALYELVETVQHWDGGMLHRLKDIAYGFATGKAYQAESDSSRERHAAS